MKRLFDLCFAGLGLLLLSPLFLFLAVLIRLCNSGPVFFVQTRTGRHFRPFSLYKFRTMAADAGGNGLSITAGGDPRVTNIGRFLRKTKLDELPQLWNVLKGDMSLVGPRPEVRKYVELFMDDYKSILDVRPGITDVASLTFSNEEEILKGRKDPEEYYINFLLPEKLKLSKEYVRNSSLSYDIRLIFSTIVRLVYPKDLILQTIDSLTPFRRPIIIGAETAIFILSSYIAFLIRFDGRIPTYELSLFWKYLPLLALIRMVLLFVFLLDRGLWRYVSEKDILKITLATSLGSFIFYAVVRHYFSDAAYPRSVYIIDWFLTVFFLLSVRLFRRMHNKAAGRDAMKKRVLIIGAGDAAEMLIRDIEQSSFYPYRVLGLIDDDPRKKGLKVRGVPVLGTMEDLNEAVSCEEPDEFIIAISSLSQQEINSLMNRLREFALPVKILPSMWGVLTGRDALSEMKVLEPEDVLFRKSADEDCIELKAEFEGKNVMVTGAGGSIGSELSAQIASCGPKRLILFERHEESLYKIDMSFRSRFPDSRSFIVPVIGDINDERRVREVMEKYRPDSVFHAAAYKHVPLMEENPYEAFKANVIGTKTVAEAARDYAVTKFVLISTDKAVNPTSVMGMTKKLAENIILTISNDRASRTIFSVVRFGNVLNSSGSVVPLFIEQIKKGGPVTVTHQAITRYFMTIPEAVRLVLHASAIGNGGEVFVLDMGEPIKILDLAKRIIGLYGYRPGIDIDIVFTGLRPGEKLYEELFDKSEIIRNSPHPKINKAVPKGSVEQNMIDTIGSLNDPTLRKLSFELYELLKHELKRKGAGDERIGEIVEGRKLGGRRGI